ncbi:MAG: hypothetical protein WC315_07145 [Candidatus Omnitrophota bacterium]
MRNTNSGEGKSINNRRGLKDFFLKGWWAGENIRQQHEPLTPLARKWTKSSTLARRSLWVLRTVSLFRRKTKERWIFGGGWYLD